MLDPRQIGELIHTHRRRQDLTQRDLASLAGVSEQTIFNLEKGHTKALYDTLQRVCAALGIDSAMPDWTRVHSDVVE